MTWNWVGGQPHVVLFSSAWHWRPVLTANTSDVVTNSEPSGKVTVTYRW